MLIAPPGLRFVAKQQQNDDRLGGGAANIGRQGGRHGARGSGFGVILLLPTVEGEAPPGAPAGEVGRA